MEFKITDSGAGMNKDAVSKLFTMYGQIDVSDYRSFHGGNGIGLRLCALLVQQAMGNTRYLLFKTP